MKWCERRSRLITSVGLSICFSALVSAQKDLPLPKSTANEHAVVISGCLRGTRLIPQSSSSTTIADTLRVSEFVLDGPKEVLQLLRKEHNGHEEEVTGVAHVPATPSDARAGVASVPLGNKARVTVGKREESGGVRPAPLPVRLTVTAVRHVSDGCTTRRR
jgi:hypothetical protein